MDEQEFYAGQFQGERWSALLTLGLLLVALFVGWQLQTAVEAASRTISQGNISAAVPKGWIVQNGAGDLVFTARNPQKPDQLYRVSQLAAGADLDTLAASRNHSRTQMDDSFRVLASEAVIVGGQEGYKVSFGRVNSSVPGIPAVIEGVDYYFRHGEQVLIISLESRLDSFSEALPRFHRFVQSVRYQAGA